MKITFVCNEYPPKPHGGIGTYYRRCAHAMQRAGHSVTVIGMGDKNGTFDDGGVCVQTLKRHPVRALAQFGNRQRLHDWLAERAKTGQIDVIEVPDFQGWLPYAFDACPVALRLHLTETIIAAHRGERARYVFRRFERETLSHHRSWLACSNDILQRTTTTFEVTPERSKVVFSPVTNVKPGDSPEWLPNSFVLFAGAVSRRKGAILVAKAAQEFLGQNPDLHLVYAGPIDREESRNCEEIIRKIVGDDLAPRVHFPGRVPNPVVLAMMQRARAFVFPSTLEAFPLVVTEAMSMGCPTVTLTIPPFTEYIENDQNGILVEPESSAALAAAINRLVNNPEHARAIGDTAKRDIHALCSEEAFVNASVGFYDELRRQCVAR